MKKALYRTVPIDVPANAPYLPPIVSQQEAWALKALMEGKASEADQGIAIRFILGNLAQIEGFPYYPTDRDTNFAMGRRFVGHQILRIVRMTPEQIGTLGTLLGAPTATEDDEMPVT